jgi:hypothetical protein
MYTRVTVGTESITVIAKTENEDSIMDESYDANVYELNPTPKNGFLSIYRRVDRGEARYPFPPVISVPAATCIVEVNVSTPEETQDDPLPIEED